MNRRLKKWHWWAIGVGGFVLLGAVGGPIVYKVFFNHADRRAEEDFDDLANAAGDASSPVTLDSLAGRWVTAPPAAGSADEDTFYVGYRVNEVLFGQKVTATGRTADVAGTLSFDGSTLTAAQFTAQLAGVTSDRANRDGQFRGRIMDVQHFPTATFTLTQPVQVTSVPADQAIVELTVTGDLTLRGTTKSVTFPIKAFQSGGRITVTGEIPIVFADWGIPNPSFGPADTEDHGSMEFLLSFARSAT